MSRKSKTAPTAKYEGALNDPLLRSSPRIEDRNIATDALRLSAETFEKLQLLADHYKIKREGPAGWGLTLAFALAQEYLPGFKLMRDDPISRELGLPDTLPQRGHPSFIPEYFSDEGLSKLAEIIVKSCDASNIKEASAIIACAFDPDVERPHRRSELAARTKTIQNRIARYRKKRVGQAKA